MRHSRKVSHKRKRTQSMSTEDFANIEVAIVKPTAAERRFKKVKQGAQGDAALPFVQENPYSKDVKLSTVYWTIPAADSWTSLPRLDSYIVENEAGVDEVESVEEEEARKIEVGHTVFVKGQDEDDHTKKEVEHWVCQILEICGGKDTPVYMRVYWFYRPEELPDNLGRQPYHGSCELIASNQMSIIDAASVHGRADVHQWNDDPWELLDSQVESDQLYWRQVLDFQKPKGQRLSKAKLYCIDKTPCHPDQRMAECEHCSAWFHPQCLEKRAVWDALQKHTEAQAQKARSPTKSKSSRSKNSKKLKSAEHKATFEAELTVSDENIPRLVLTSELMRGHKQAEEVDIRCLICNSLIGGAASDGIDHGVPPVRASATALVDEDAGLYKVDDSNDAEATARGDANDVGQSGLGPHSTVSDGEAEQREECEEHIQHSQRAQVDVAQPKGDSDGADQERHDEDNCNGSGGSRAHATAVSRYLEIRLTNGSPGHASGNVDRIAGVHGRNELTAGVIPRQSNARVTDRNDNFLDKHISRLAESNYMTAVQSTTTKFGAARMSRHGRSISNDVRTGYRPSKASSSTGNKVLSQEHLNRHTVMRSKSEILSIKSEDRAQPLISLKETNGPSASAHEREMTPLPALLNKSVPASSWTRHIQRLIWTPKSEKNK